jgi:hypothetical protein
VKTYIGIALIVALGLASIITIFAYNAVVSDKGENSGPAPTTHYTFYQELPTGNKVLCVWAGSGSAGGVTCDFAGDSVVKE